MRCAMGWKPASQRQKPAQPQRKPGSGGKRPGADRKLSPGLAELVAIERKVTIAETAREYAFEAIASLVTTMRRGRRHRHVPSVRPRPGAGDGLSVSDDTIYRAMKDLGFSHVGSTRDRRRHPPRRSPATLGPRFLGMSVETGRCGA
jgi:hypothetical protein